MANVIKHKRGSGSDPVASDLVVGEVAIRTDVGKLFTKMDNGSVAEIAGGGSDIAINTLSSSSATGGGSATFNGSAYRFTLSAPPSVSAQQLLVSINGVIQKPVAGTGQPSEGFSVDGTDIILGDAPATGSDFFILTFKSLGVSEPADNSVTSAKIVDGAIVNADINASAAIAGTKISPNFGTQDLLVNGKISLDASKELGVFEADTSLGFTNSAKLSFDFSSNLARIRSSGNGSFSARPLTFNIVNTEAMRIDTSGKVGIGTTTIGNKLQVHEASSNASFAGFSNDTTGSSSSDGLIVGLDSDENGVLYHYENKAIRFATNNTERMRIDSSGNVGIGTTSPGGFNPHAQELVVRDANGTCGITISTPNDTIGRLAFADPEDDNVGEVRYTHSANTMEFTVNAAERMRIDSSGDVLINRNTSIDVASTATSKLQVHHSSGNISAAFYSTADALGPSGVLALGHARGSDSGVLQDNDVLGQIRFAGGDGNDLATVGALISAEVNGTPSGNVMPTDLVFSTNVGSGSTTERMRIQKSGNVGIGTADPGDNRVLVQLGDANTSNFKVKGGSGQGRTTFSVQAGNTTSTATTSYRLNDSSGNTVASLFFANNTDDLQISTAKQGGEILFNTSSTANSSGSVNRARFDMGGNFFLGKSSTDQNNTGVELMQNGQSKFTRNGGSTALFNRNTNNGTCLTFSRSGNIAGSISVTTTTATFNNGGSDRSLKKNFESWTENTLDLFKKLNPQKFNYIIEDDGAEKTKGYIAQDLVDSFPEAYPKNDDDKYMFNPSGMVVYLMKAIQELTAKVEALEAK